jgi:multiple sugar transport system ATP-binding protein
MAEVEFDNIYKRYADGFEAVKHLNLDIRDGELMVLVGPSGSGKSTALRMVAGLEDVSQGEVRIGGEVVNDRAPKDRDIAMVFQNYALYPHMTVRQNMGFGLKLAKVHRPEIDRRVDEAAALLDLEQHLERKPANLSGGQRQRVALGRAIVRTPSAFLMDEPLSNLDAKLRVQTRTVIARIQQRLGTTTIYVTHDQIEALTLGHRIAVMRAGELQQVGPPGDVYARPLNLFVAGFIGSPSMNFLPGELFDDSVRLPIGTLALDDELRRAVHAAPGPAGREIIVGMRPAHFEDSALVSPEQHGGATFTAKIEVLESLGSEYYAYFDVDSDRVTADEFEELAQDSGSTDPLHVGSRRVQMIARLSDGTKARQGQSLKLWFDPRHLQLFDPATGRSLLAGVEPPAADITAGAIASAAS